MKKMVWLDIVSLLISVFGLLVGIHYWEYFREHVSSPETVALERFISMCFFLEFLSLLYAIMMLLTNAQKRRIWLLATVIISAVALFILYLDTPTMGYISR